MVIRPIYYDTETTGTDPQKDRIVEIAAYDPHLQKEFQTLVNPGCVISQEVIAIHGITNEMVANSPSFAEAGKAFIEFCAGEVVLIAHNNEGFDRHFLLHEAGRHQLSLPEWPMIDTLRWARKYRPDLPKHNLQFLRQVYGIQKNQAHRALNDVVVLHQIFSLMIDDLPLETVMKLLDTSQILLEMPFGKYQGKPLNEVPLEYISWLKEQGALDKPENFGLKKGLEKAGLLPLPKPIKG
jgi:DNA polymerase III subunit epsilon